MNAARRLAIVVDFDGTILPSTPWDSEQELLLARAEAPDLPQLKRLHCRLAAFADRRRWLGDSFKRHYVHLLQGARRDLIDELAPRLAQRVASGTQRGLRELRERGHRLIVVSCGTADLSEGVLRAAGVLDLFEELIGNRFVFTNGAIVGIDLSVPTPQSKVEELRRRGLAPESTVAVGDGPTDLPLLRWAGVPVVVAHDGAGFARLAARLAARRVPGCTLLHSIAELPEVVRRHGG